MLNGKRNLLNYSENSHAEAQRIQRAQSSLKLYSLASLRACFFILLFFSIFALSSCVSTSEGAISAEEYYSLGVAYMDMGRYEEAEVWFQRAQQTDKTKAASEYNLGRIAFETGRYEESAEIFEDIISQDPQNTLALKAAAYARIKNGDLEAAENHYQTLLELVPESADDGYNYALVLFALGKPSEASGVISKYAFALEENDDLLLLYARIQKAENKIEAVDNYDLWLKKNDDVQVKFEYGETLEKAELYARALETYREILDADLSTAPNLSRPQIRFSIARVLLIADPSVNDGITELQGAVDDGFNDKEAIGELLDIEAISAEHKEEIRTIIDGISDIVEEEVSDEEAANDEETTDTEENEEESSNQTFGLL
jgi:tetratricopeptide (TPR) repeat protein